MLYSCAHMATVGIKGLNCRTMQRLGPSRVVDGVDCIHVLLILRRKPPDPSGALGDRVSTQLLSMTLASS